MLKLKFQYFVHLMQRANLLEKTLILGMTEGRRRRGQQRRQLDGITDSMDMGLSNLWEMVKDREAWHTESMGLKRVGHDKVTEQQQNIILSVSELPVQLHGCCFSDTKSSHRVVSDSSQPYRQQHTRPPCPTPSPQFSKDNVH